MARQCREIAQRSRSLQQPKQDSAAARGHLDRYSGGRGSAGKFVSDDAVYNETRAAVTDLRISAAKISSIADDFKSISVIWPPAGQCRKVP